MISLIIIIILLVVILLFCDNVTAMIIAFLGIFFFICILQLIYPQLSLDDIIKKLYNNSKTLLLNIFNLVKKKVKKLANILPGLIKYVVSMQLFLDVFNIKKKLI